MKRIGLLLFAIISVSHSFAKTENEDNFEFTRNRASISDMLTSSDSWLLEAAYHYMLNKYIGLGGSIGVWKVYFEEGFASGKDWNIDNEDSKQFNVFLRPSIVLKSPALRLKQINIGLYAEPGMMLNIPYTHVSIMQYSSWPNFEYDKQRAMVCRRCPVRDLCKHWVMRFFSRLYDIES